MFLPTSFSFVICNSMVSRRGQFLLITWPIQFSFLCRIFFDRIFFSPIRSRTSSLVTFSGHYIFSILLQYNISKLSRCFRSNFLNNQDSEANKANTRNISPNKFLIENKLIISAMGNLHYKISREKFEPEPGFKPRTSGIRLKSVV